VLDVIEDQDLKSLTRIFVEKTGELYRLDKACVESKDTINCLKKGVDYGNELISLMDNSEQLKALVNEYETYQYYVDLRDKRQEMLVKLDLQKEFRLVLGELKSDVDAINCDDRSSTLNIEDILKQLKVQVDKFKHIYDENPKIDENLSALDMSSFILLSVYESDALGEEAVLQHCKTVQSQFVQGIDYFLHM